MANGQHPNRSPAAELLAFYAEAGVDAALNEEPRNRLEADPVPAVPESVPQARAAEPLAPRPAPPVAKPATPPAPDAAVMAAREAARSAASLDELRSILESFEGCALKASASRL